MPVDRPTFSESWYRVAEIKPTLRSTVQVCRQHFRGQMWHVLEDPAANQFFRLNASAYYFVAMLDGRRSVSEVWRICNEQLGDAAATQEEVIRLLGQLYTSNLLWADMPPDAEGLLRRYRKRRVRELKGHLTNLLFIRVPLIDPDHFLDCWVGIFGWVFSRYGLALWLVLMGTGAFFLMGRVADLADRASGIFDPANLAWLYVSFVLVKVFHEFGHAFACKRFGVQAGGGQVHVMGVMFLVFTPLPYLDASSAWAFRSKWQRAIVGAGGMYVELAIAAIAAIVWANTAQGTVVHAVCYNAMFLAGVSTLLFNGNPLLRFDAYYILSDLLEIPNLAQRSRQYLYYLVRRYAWSVRRAVSPAYALGERIWLAFYGVASTVYRLFIFAMILLFLSDRLPRPLAVVAIAFGVMAAIAWLVVPVGKFVRYLAGSGELARVRVRAVTSTLAVAVAVFVAVGWVRVPDRCRVEGIVEPIDMAVLYAEVDGFVADFLPTGRRVSASGPVLLRCENPELAARCEKFLAERRKLDIQRGIAQTQEPAAAQVLAEQIVAIDERIDRARSELASLQLRSPLDGVWIAPDVDRRRGAHLRRGDRVGLVANLENVLIRAVAGQDASARLFAEKQLQVQIRVKGRPETHLAGRVLRILPAGKERLPSAALGYQAGGAMQTAAEDPRGTQTADRFFEIHVAVAPDVDARLLSGQRVIVRFEMPAKPLLKQWWRRLQRLLQRRFHRVNAGS